MGRFIAKRGEGLHHVALRVSDLEATVEKLEGAGGAAGDGDDSGGRGRPPVCVCASFEIEWGFAGAGGSGWERVLIRILSKDALLLGVDTCGPSGSIKLARLTHEGADGDWGGTGLRVANMLLRWCWRLLICWMELGLRSGIWRGLVAVAGPGSFTGIRDWAGGREGDC